MNHRLIGALALTAWLAAAPAGAEMHRPLPAWSTQRNGEPQPMRRHFMGRPQGEQSPAPGRLAPGAPQPYSGAPIDVKTYHYNAQRTGWNARETDLTPATVASAKFGQIAKIPVSGLVVAQPLLISNFPMPDGLEHDVLIVATSHNDVYAFDARSYTLLWHVSLGKNQSAADVGCGDLPAYGVSATPVISRTAPGVATLYVAAATEPAAFSFHQKLHALDLKTGADLVTPVEIAPSAPLPGGGTISYDPQNQYTRAGLAWRHGSLYVGIGSHCDDAASSISGWVLHYDSKLNLLNAFNTIQAMASYELSAVWMSGVPPAVDAAGNVFVVTGNGYFSQRAGKLGYGETAISLTPTLGVRSTFTPSNWAQLNSGDTDFGSGGIVLLPAVSGQTAPPLAVTMGKDAKLFLLNQNSLGGLTSTNSGALWHKSLGSSGGGLWGAPAYYADATGGIVYVQIDSDVLRAFRVNAGAKPGLAAGASGTSAAGFGGSMPIVSSNGAQAGTAVVWLVRRGSSETLEAYDAEKLGAPIFTGAAGSWAPNQSNALVTAMEANGRVYVGAEKVVTVFGLAQ